MTHRYTEFNPAPGSSHELVLELVPRGARVLDVGCATGAVAEALGRRLGCSVVGVEVAAEAADAAREHCERVIAGDVEQLDLEAELADDRFDVVLLADVLEHLRDPASLLERVRPLLADGGSVVASIPNVAHGSVRLALLGGDFRYRERGLLDDTHLRFFTRATAQELFERAGYVVTTWRRARLEIDRAEIAVSPAAVPGDLWERLAADADATTYQFVVRAQPVDEPATIAALRAELRELEAARELAAQRERELEDLRPLRAVVEEQRARLEELAGAEDARDRLRELEAREQELRALLLDAHEQLLQRDEEIDRLRLEAAGVLLKRRLAARFPRLAAVYRRARHA